MHRIDSLNARPDLNGLGKAGFHDNTDLPGQDGTYLTPVWFNSVQEELTHVIETAGITLDKSQNDQLLAALDARFASKNEFNALRDLINGYFGAQGNGTYTTPGTYHISVASGTGKRIRLWGAGGSGGAAYDGNGGPDGSHGGDTTITGGIVLIAGGGKAGKSGSWANGSAYADGAGGAGGIATGTDGSTTTNGNAGHGNTTDQQGGLALNSGYGAGGTGQAGSGDNGYGYGGGGGSGAFVEKVYMNDTGATVTLTLVVGAKGALDGRPEMAGGDGGAIIEAN